MEYHIIWSNGMHLPSNLSHTHRWLMCVRIRVLGLQTGERKGPPPVWAYIGHMDPTIWRSQEQALRAFLAASGLDQRRPSSSEGHNLCCGQQISLIWCWSRHKAEDFRNGGRANENGHTAREDTLWMRHFFWIVEFLNVLPDDDSACCGHLQLNGFLSHNCVEFLKSSCFVNNIVLFFFFVANTKCTLREWSNCFSTKFRCSANQKRAICRY